MMLETMQENIISLCILWCAENTAISTQRLLLDTGKFLGKRADQHPRRHPAHHGSPNQRSPLFVITPSMVQISPVAKSNKKTGVSDPLQDLLNPLRIERSFGPSMLPASFMNSGI